MSMSEGIVLGGFAVAVVVTGSIGLLTMLARTVYLERRNAR